MNYEIVELEEYKGKKATIYSILMEGDEYSMFDHFLIDHIQEYKEEVKSILGRLEQINQTTGAREIFFKQHEGKPGDGVCALFDTPESKLRLYCIRYGKTAVILGGGGPKSTEIRAWQEDEKLSKEASLMIQISKEIMNRIMSGDITWSTDGCHLEGNLIISENE